MILTIFCAHRWSAPTFISLQNDEQKEIDKLSLRFCQGCSASWRSDQKEPRVAIGYLEDSATQTLFPAGLENRDEKLNISHYKPGI
jgi:hypothetical protein